MHKILRQPLKQKKSVIKYSYNYITDLRKQTFRKDFKATQRQPLVKPNKP